VHARLSPALAGLLALVLVAGACSDGDGSDGLEGAGGSEGSVGGVGTIAGGLAALPESGEDTESIVWGDMARAAEIAGLERPDDPGDSEAVVDYLQPLTAGRVDPDTTAPVMVVPPEAAGADRLAEMDAFADELGWSLLDVDRFIERQTAPDIVTVMEGRFDEGAITDALGEQSEGLWVAGDPDGEPFQQDLQDITVARPLGQSLWMGLDGDRLTVARSPDSAESAGSDGEGPTLADDEPLAELAAALDAEDPYAAMLVRPGLSADPVNMRATPEMADALCDAVLPAETTAVATGLTDDDGPVYLIALAHGSSGAADANARALEELIAEGSSIATRRSWSDLVTLDGVEVTGDDRVVVARLRQTEPGPPGLWYQIVQQRESLVSHC
jgi:hypothetical protein